MIQNENISVYESTNYYTDSSYNIISLRECQGFIFNQDLFASPYQQQRTLANERKMKCLGSKSRTNSVSKDRERRRHTSYHARPDFRSYGGSRESRESAIEDSAIEDSAIEDEEDNVEYEGGYKVQVTEIIVNDDEDIFPEKV